MSSHPRSHVLILYTDTGSGHRSVARALERALRVLSSARATPAERVPYAALRNPVERHPLGNLFDLYGPVTRRAPRLFADVYHLSDHERVCDLTGRLAYGLLRQRFARLIAATQPGVIVCVHSLLTRPLLQTLRAGAHDIPLFSVVTDLTSIHHSWIVPAVDQCFVPTTEARDEMARRGMADERLCVSGLPVDPRFTTAIAGDERQSVRQALGLHPDLFTVLVMGGGEGVGGLDRIAGALATSCLPVQVIAVAGRNPALYRNLVKQQCEWAAPHRVVGFAHNVPDLMRAADVVVTKAGSVTIAEALACGLPIILSSVIEGQESGNVDYLERNGVGRLARGASDVVAAVGHLLQLDEPSMQDLRARASRLSAPNASFVIAERILATLDARQTHAADPDESAFEALLV
ncbi:MAG TPA: glycosyltransferase [Ktedonobacterales bacterium]|nr:glycosyltransferase [Ktedonobacterales bacterium]